MKRKESGLSRLRKLLIPDEEALEAIANHVGLNHSQEARSVYVEAQKGNKVAQFIVGLALQEAKRHESAGAWLSLSAEQGFGPAKQHLKKAG